MIKYVIFDFDGTICNTLPVWLRLYRETLKLYKIDVPDKEISDKCFGVKDGVVNLGISKDALEDFYDKLLERKSEIYSAKTFSGFKDMAKSLLSKGFKLSIATASSIDPVNNYLDKAGLAKLFDVVIGYEDVKKLKPDPESIFKIMDFYGDKNADSYIIIGDSDKDILAGKNAGIKTGLFYANDGTNIHDKKHLLSLKPDIVFERWEDFRF